MDLTQKRVANKQCRALLSVKHQQNESPSQLYRSAIHLSRLFKDQVMDAIVACLVITSPPRAQFVRRPIVYTLWVHMSYAMPNPREIGKVYTVSFLVKSISSLRN